MPATPVEIGDGRCGRRGADGIRRRLRRSTDKTAAMTMPAKLPKDIGQEKAGLRTPAANRQGRPLSALRTGYRAHHADQGNTHEQTVLTARRCELTFAGCGFPTLADVDAAAVDSWMASRRRESKRFGVQTHNHYVAAVTAFGTWLRDTKKATENPFRPLAKQNVAVGCRPLTPEECDRLLLAARTGKRFGKLSGSARALLHTVAADTGFRASELASLSPSSFALDATPPPLTVEAGYSKHRRKDTAEVAAADRAKKATTGAVAVARPATARPSSSGGSGGHSPRDAALRLSADRLTAAAARVVDLAGTLGSFAEAAAKTLPELCGLRLGESTVERTAERVGPRWASGWRRARRSARRNRGTGPRIPRGNGGGRVGRPHGRGYAGVERGGRRADGGRRQGVECRPAGPGAVHVRVGRAGRPAAVAGRSGGMGAVCHLRALFRSEIGQWDEYWASTAA